MPPVNTGAVARPADAVLSAPAGFSYAPPDFPFIADIYGPDAEALDLRSGARARVASIGRSVGQRSSSRRYASLATSRVVDRVYSLDAADPLHASGPPVRAR